MTSGVMMMNEYKRLIDIIPDGLTDGVFAYFDTKNVPWAEEDISARLDYEYFGNISGDKIASPALEKFDANGAHTDITDLVSVSQDVMMFLTKVMEHTPKNGSNIILHLASEIDPIHLADVTIPVTLGQSYGVNVPLGDNYVRCVYDGNKTITLVSHILRMTFRNYHYTYTVTDWTSIYDIILAMNLTRWQKLWNTLNFQYDPISNYDMTEIMTDDETVIEYGKTDTRTDNLSHGHSEQETETPNLTRITTNKVNGFNGSTAQPADETEEHTTGTNGTSRQGTDTDTGTQTNVGSGSDTHTRNYELHRTGNIGVTTSQQMLESERAVWMWKFFYDVVFPDCDRVLTIQTY